MSCMNDLVMYKYIHFLFLNYDYILSILYEDKINIFYKINIKTSYLYTNYFKIMVNLRV